MKTYGFALAVVLMFQQQSCEQRITTEGRAGVEKEIHNTLIPRVKAFFPEAEWVQSEDTRHGFRLLSRANDTRYIFINTGVSAVSERFLENLRAPLANNLSEIQQRKNSVQGILANAIGVFPEIISFAFNLPECVAGTRYDRGLPLGLDYSVATGQISPSSPIVQYVECDEPTSEMTGSQPAAVPPAVPAVLPSLTMPSAPDVGRGGATTPPLLVHKVEPEYSPQARQARLEGTVELRALVRADGSVGEITVVRSLGLGLDEKAVEAVRQWRFRPGMRNGQPVNVSAVIEIAFRLNQ